MDGNVRIRFLINVRLKQVGQLVNRGAPIVQNESPLCEASLNSTADELTSLRSELCLTKLVSLLTADGNARYRFVRHI